MFGRLAAALAVATTLIAAPAHAATTAPPAEVAAFPVSIDRSSVNGSVDSVARTGPASYVVRPGDTLGRIAAAQCGRSSAYRSLAAASGISNPDRIFPGQRIVLNCTAAPAAHAPAPARKAAPRAAAPTAVLAAAGSTSGAVAYAMRQIGKPYVFGAMGPNSFDCSGLVVAAYRSIGVSLPHFTGSLRHLGVSVRQKDLRPGDIVFLSPSHVGLFIGGNQVVVAPQTGENVKVQTIWNYTDGRRI